MKPWKQQKSLQGAKKDIDSGKKSLFAVVAHGGNDSEGLNLICKLSLAVKWENGAWESASKIMLTHLFF